MKYITPQNFEYSCNSFESQHLCNVLMTRVALQNFEILFFALLRIFAFIFCSLNWKHRSFIIILFVYLLYYFDFLYLCITFVTKNITKISQNLKYSSPVSFKSFYLCAVLIKKIKNKQITTFWVFPWNYICMVFS